MTFREKFTQCFPEKDGKFGFQLSLDAILLFRNEVNSRAEAEMLKTGNISGAHHRAIEAVWKDLQQ